MNWKESERETKVIHYITQKVSVMIERSKQFSYFGFQPTDRKKGHMNTLDENERNKEKNWWEINAA